MTRHAGEPPGQYRGKYLPWEQRILGVVTTPKDEMQITYCHQMGYLPMLREDGSTHMQPWYVDPDTVGCMLSPESIMAALPNITSWYQEGFRDG
jgi:hypothetical protein